MAGVFSGGGRGGSRRSAGLAGALLGVWLLGGCDPADDFFAGRPSAMAMAHNRALDGSIDSVRAILEIPAQLPQANERHHGAWQESPIAWWLAPGGRERIQMALAQLDRRQLDALILWLASPDAYGEQKQRALLELRQAAAAARKTASGNGVPQ